MLRTPNSSLTTTQHDAELKKGQFDSHKYIKITDNRAGLSYNKSREDKESERVSSRRDFTSWPAYLSSGEWNSCYFEGVKERRHKCRY